MSQEQETPDTGFFSNLKNQLLTGVGVVVTTLGTVFIDEVKSVVGLGEEPQSIEQQAPAINNQQSVNVTGPEVIINIPEQRPVETRTVIIRDTVPKAPERKKEKEELIDW